MRAGAGPPISGDESARKLDRGATLRLSLPRLRGSRIGHRARRAVQAPRGRSRSAGRDLARAADRQGPPGAGARSCRTRARASSPGWSRGSARGGCARAGRDESPRHGHLRTALRRRSAATRPPLAGGGIEHRHRGLGGGGNLRAAVFGVNDGLVSNASLILGVAGATQRPAGRRDHRRRRHGGRRICDGGGRIRLGALAARALRVPDRARARRAQAIPGSRGAGARADLRGEGAAARSRRAASRSGSSPIPSMRSTRWRARSSDSTPTSWARRWAPPRARSARSPPARCCRCCRSCSAPGRWRLPAAIGAHRRRAVRASARRCRCSPAATRVYSGAAHARARRARGRRHVTRIGRLFGVAG